MSSNQSWPPYTTFSGQPLGTTTITATGLGTTTTVTNPTYSGTVTLTPQISGTYQMPQTWSVTIPGPLITSVSLSGEQMLIYLIGQLLRGQASSRRTEETRRKLVESAYLDARAVLEAIRRVDKLTSILGQKPETCDQEAQAKSP
jgi:hypothetical protein